MLASIGLDPQLWTLQPRSVKTVDDMRAYVVSALGDRDAGVSLPYVIRDSTSGDLVGSTRLMDIARAHRRVEIGATWLTPRAQRTGANVEAKLLLLSHAFEVMQCQKVVLKTEASNAQSRAAIARLGATEEGTFRRHLLADSGRPRDMVFYAILDNEWPDVRKGLKERLALRR